MSIAVISSSIVFIFLPILGIIFSTLGIVKAQTLKKGRKMAITGLVFSILGLVITAAVWIYVLIAAAVL